MSHGEKRRTTHPVNFSVASELAKVPVAMPNDGKQLRGGDDRNIIRVRRHRAIDVYRPQATCERETRAQAILENN